MAEKGLPAPSDDTLILVSFAFANISVLTSKKLRFGTSYEGTLHISKLSESPRMLKYVFLFVLLFIIMKYEMVETPI